MGSISDMAHIERYFAAHHAELLERAMDEVPASIRALAGFDVWLEAGVDRVIATLRVSDGELVFREWDLWWLADEFPED
ncbi:MAG: hypothetical protein ACYDCK_04405 [Thermoplasmatota archaeon]